MCMSVFEVQNQLKTNRSVFFSCFLYFTIGLLLHYFLPSFKSATGVCLLKEHLVKCSEALERLTS